jgi:hypothetical protein
LNGFTLQVSPIITRIGSGAIYTQVSPAHNVNTAPNIDFPKQQDRAAVRY